MRILIADDSELVRRALRDLLSKEAGHEVCGEAGDGSEAIERVRELRPDLVLLDIWMPSGNGFETSRQLRDQFPALKILIMSQEDAVRLLPSARRAGADGCLDKSQLGADLFDAIRNLGNARACGSAGN